MTDPRLERTVDQDALALYLRYQYVPAPHTILRDVQKLPPAHVLAWEGDSAPRLTRYWELPYEPKTRISKAEQREAGLEILRESVRLQMRSDVPIGVFLSGGIDSSLVTALVAAESSQPVRTFSIGFDDPAYDESRYARVVARRYGTDHTEEVVRLDAISLLPELAEHFDEPFGDSSAIPTFRVAQLAARELKVVLTGDGGDEGFGGYDRYRFQLGMRQLDWLPAGPRSAIAQTASLLLATSRPRMADSGRMARWGAFASLTPSQRYLQINEIFNTALASRLLGRQADGSASYLLNILDDGPRDSVDKAMRTDLLAYLPGDLLVKTDRAAMANSLETRSPLLDHKVLEFAATLPSDRKVTLRKTKVLLREIAIPLLSEEVVNRPKMGFGAPIDAWFKAELGDQYHELVLCSDSRTRDLLDHDVAAELLDGHRSGAQPNAHRLWAILMFELWARRWLSHGANGLSEPSQ